MVIKMVKIFSGVLRLSILAGVMVPVILGIRLFLEKAFHGKAPKSLRCMLWMLVGIRLIVPFSIESVFGFLPEGRIFPEGRIIKEQGASAESIWNQEAGVIGESSAIGQIAPEGGMQGRLPAFLRQQDRQTQLLQRERAQLLMSGLWCAGVLLMLGYFVYNWFKLKRCVRESEQRAYPLEGREVMLRQCGGIETPFLFGILRPEIYVPFSMDGKDLPYIVRHELAHKRRRDHLVKPLSFLLLAVHWFNPFIWIAYKMLCRDMELACDEMVIRDMEVKDRKAYSRALLNCSVWKEKVAACPVAFGELSVKERVRNILNYKKPGILAICLGVLLCAVLLCGFMTRRKEENAQRILLTNEAGRGTDSRKENAQSNARRADETEPEGGRREEQSRQEAEQANEQIIGIQSMLENQETTVSDLEDEAERLTYLTEWAGAVCDRDGKALTALCSEELLETFREGITIISLEGDEPGFGWSSPWPWDSGADYRIVSQTENGARILYYAWTSDPHVTVWEEDVTYHRENERYVMDTSEMNILDSICTGEEFYRAYPEGVINGTRMDYLSNGTGEALNINAEAGGDFYESLFEPDTAARFLLNLLNNDNKVEITVERLSEEEAGETAQISIQFILDHTQMQVTMIRPYGEDGIWIPQTQED